MVLQDILQLDGLLQEEVDEDAIITPMRDVRPVYTSRLHKTVCLSQSKYIQGNVYINDVMPFWSMLKRAYCGTIH